MRLTDEMINYIAERITKRICSLKDLSISEDQEKEIKKIVVNVIKNDIERERQIEEEAHRLLRAHIKEIESEGISYHKMFQIVKQKLAKERGIVL